MSQPKLSDYTLREHVIGWSQLIGIFGFGIWAVYAMVATAPAGLIVMGALIWWFLQTAEAEFNGGQTDIESVFGYACDDFKNNFTSDAWEHRMKLSNGDEEWAEMYPGKIHFIISHVCIPLCPVFLWVVF